MFHGSKSTIAENYPLKLVHRTYGPLNSPIGKATKLLFISKLKYLLCTSHPQLRRYYKLNHIINRECELSNINIILVCYINFKRITRKNNGKENLISLLSSATLKLGIQQIIGNNFHINHCTNTSQSKYSKDDCSPQANLSWQKQNLLEINPFSFGAIWFQFIKWIPGTEKFQILKWGHWLRLHCCWWQYFATI